MAKLIVWDIEEVPKHVDWVLFDYDLKVLEKLLAMGYQGTIDKLSAKYLAISNRSNDIILSWGGSNVKPSRTMVVVNIHKYLKTPRQRLLSSIKNFKE